MFGESQNPWKVVRHVEDKAQHLYLIIYDPRAKELLVEYVLYSRNDFVRFSEDDSQFIFPPGVHNSPYKSLGDLLYKSRESAGYGIILICGKQHVSISKPLF